MPKSVERCSTIHVEFLERALVEENLDAFARRQLAALVLRLDARLAAAQTGDVAAAGEFHKDVLHRKVSSPPHRRGTIMTLPVATAFCQRKQRKGDRTETFGAIAFEGASLPKPAQAPSRSCSALSVASGASWGMSWPTPGRMRRS